jgi:FkbM family methyltransferase
VALAERNGSVNMYAAVEVPSQARQVIQPSGDDTVSVPSVSLESLLQKIGADKVDLLKMDIEGSEHPALLNARRNTLEKISRLNIEYHQTGSKTVLFGHLTSNGFVLRRDRILGTDYGVAEFVR